MNFFKYLESRFVSSQIAINNKQISSATSGISANHAFKGWMWLCLKAMTVVNFLLLPFHYLAVVLRLIAPPRSAAAQMQDIQMQEKAKAELAAKVQADMLANAMKDRSDAGLDELPRKGSA